MTIATQKQDVPKDTAITFEQYMAEYAPKEIDADEVSIEDADADAVGAELAEKSLQILRAAFDED